VALGTRLPRRVGLIGWHQFDNKTQPERHQVDDMRADGRLAFEFVAGKPAVLGELVPQRAFGLGRIAAQEPRQPANRAPSARALTLVVLVEQRTQHQRLVAVEQTAARRPLPSVRDRQDHTVQGLDILLGGLHAVKYVVQVEQHSLTLLRRTEKFHLVEFTLQVGEEG
jgi:hypothetical protein